ncbi:hypothetical protein CR513_42589, partial [Mucuna pruriens]
MYQGSKSIEEYFKEMEVALMRANVLEPNEAICTKQLELSLNKGGVYPQRDPTPTILIVGRVRNKRENDLERIRVQRRGVSHHMAERKKLPHLTLVLLRAISLSVLSAWTKGTLPPNAPIRGT